MQNRVELVQRMTREIPKRIPDHDSHGAVRSSGRIAAESDILSALYFDIMNLRPGEPGWPERDQFVLSKGQACPALYAVLALRERAHVQIPVAYGL